MSLSEHSLDQLARVRRLLQHFAAPDPGVRLITLDVEAHAAALEPEIAVLDPAPFGVLSKIEANDAASGDAALRERRPARASVTPGDAARKQRRQEMLTPSNLSRPSHNSLVPEALSPTSAPQPLASAQPPASKRPQVAVARQQTPSIDTSDATADAENKQPKGSTTPVAAALQNAAKQVAASPQAGSVLQDKVELDTLVQRVLRKGRQLRNAQSSKGTGLNDLSQHTALTPRARSYDATAIQQRPLPPLVVLPVSPAGTSAAPNDAIAVTQQYVRSNITELVSTPRAGNKHENAEHSHARASARPTFFFNALEPREAEEPEQALTDRIDHVLREQARRQGVDLT